MLNGLVEDWFDGPLSIGYRALLMDRRVGLPTIRLEADFRAISRFGDHVALSLDVAEVRQRSFALSLACTAVDTGEVRMQARQVIVATSLDTHRAIELPADLRAAMQRPETIDQPRTSK